MQPPVMSDFVAQQNNFAAMMWQMQMAQVQPMLNVRVDGLKFEYQLTEDDVRKVFSRYGGVSGVHVDREGTKATVTFDQAHQAMAAQQDLDRKQLAGMSGAFLRVEFAMNPWASPMLPGGMPGVDAVSPWASPMLPGTMAGVYSVSPWASPMPPNTMAGVYPVVPPLPGHQSMAMPSTPGGRPKKYTCKLEVGIENEGEFRVGSRVIQIARQIWQDAKFQEHGGKTRLRGKGIGGPHEADEPLALCISCREQDAFDKAVLYAETQLQKVHSDFKAFCLQKGRPVPELAVKVSKKGASFFGPGDGSLTPGAEVPKGERPANAPTDEEIEDFIEQRNEARKAANFKKADEVREFLKQRGVVLMDEKGAKGNFQGKEVTKWRFWRP